MPYYPMAPRMRRGFNRGVRRRKVNWQFVRQTFNDPTVVIEPNAFFADMLLNFRQDLGITLNFPDITIWRVRLKVSIKITIPTTTVANEGALIAVYTNQSQQTSQVPAITNPYTYKYMLWDFKYATEQELLAGTVANTDKTLYAEYDIKTHRRLENLNDTLWLQIQAGPGTTLNGFSATQVTLLRLGRR